MKIKWEKNFDASHRIYKDYQGKCNNIHGHTYRVLLEIEGKMDDRGMVVDFNVLKHLVHDFYDHKIILHRDDPLVECLKKNKQNMILLSQNPTAENIARQIACNIMGHLEVEYVRVTLYETQTQGAIFTLKKGENTKIEWEEINYQ